MDSNPRAPADVLKIGALVGVLETSPATDVICENALENGIPGFHLPDHALQALALLNAEPAFTFIREYPDDFHPPPCSKFLDAIELVLGRVLLVLCRHAHVGRNRHQRTGRGEMIEWLMQPLFDMRDQ